MRRTLVYALALLVITGLSQLRVRAQSATANVLQLLRQLDDADPTVRGAAAMRLEVISDASAVPALLNAFRAQTAHRAVLLRALAKFKDRRKIPVFIAAAREQHSGTA